MDREILVWRISGRENTRGWLRDVLFLSRKGRAPLDPFARTAQLAMHFFRCGLPSQDSPGPQALNFPLTPAEFLSHPCSHLSLPRAHSVRCVNLSENRTPDTMNSQTPRKLQHLPCTGSRKTSLPTWDLLELPPCLAGCKERITRLLLPAGCWCCHRLSTNYL